MTSKAKWGISGQVESSDSGLLWAKFSREGYQNSSETLPGADCEPENPRAAQETPPVDKGSVSGTHPQWYYSLHLYS